MSDTLIDTPNDIHGYMGLSYANYLVLHRTVLQSMPEAWQQAFVALLEEYDAASADLEFPEAYEVITGTLHDVGELPVEFLGALNIERHEYETAAGPAYVYYAGVEGDELSPTDQVLLPGDDPIPHYERGRTRLPLRTTVSATETGQ